MFKKILCTAAAALLALTASGCGNAETPASGNTGNGETNVGCLSCLGLDEDGVRKWTQDTAEAEGRDPSAVNNSNIIFFDNTDSMVMAVKSGKIDCISTSYNVGQYIVNRNDDLELVDNNYPAILGYSMALPESRSDEAKLIDKAIADMKEDGTIDALVEKYITGLGSSDPEPTGFVTKEGRDTIKVAVTGDMPSMDLILADGTPSGFNTAFLSELSGRIDRNIETVSVEANARATALASGRVDAIFWTRGTYDKNGNTLKYLLDRIDGICMTKPYLMDRRVMVKLKSK